MAACGRRIKFLVVALLISVCILLRLELRIITLMSEADEARFLAEDAVRERDRMRLRDERDLERKVSKVVDSEVPRSEREKEKETLPATPNARATAVESPEHEKIDIMNKKFQYHFKVAMPRIRQIPCTQQTCWDYFASLHSCMRNIQSMQHGAAGGMAAHGTHLQCISAFVGSKWS